ncbi:phosphoesterase [Ornithinibacillus gellani]|uniref:phosphatase PAP2 family protein n=1 Tax=Ornithinibacillus gellani TaxID=2293253 RepID=UPI000F4955C9|nr:phosphatase PAP2 family protein [Ornithinibacillus gellani]TQS71238.1 phosphoesterase [Ornithinibacillus gellani]
MNQIKNRWIHLLWLLVFPVLGLSYALLNVHNGSVLQLGSVIDDRIPLLPIFAVPYLFWYVYILGYLVYFWWKDLKVYKHTLITIVIGEVICFTCYYFFQSTVVRPALQGDGIFVSMVQFIYNHDEPFNCFPSIHVLTTYAIMLASVHIKDKHMLHAGFVQLMGTLIILSTVFTKQHVVVDAVASILIVSMSYSTIRVLSNVHNMRLAKQRVIMKTNAIRKKRAFRL